MGKHTMLRLGVTMAAVAVLGLLSPTGARAAVGQRLDQALGAVSPFETTGCYRLGETGYHWYDFCVGPRFLYPHHRVCRHGHCYYR